MRPGRTRACPVIGACGLALPQERPPERSSGPRTMFASAHFHRVSKRPKRGDRGQGVRGLDRGNLSPGWRRLNPDPFHRVVATFIGELIMVGATSHRLDRDPAGGMALFS